MNSLMLSLFNWKPEDEARYSVLLDQGPFEIRFYQSQICAKVSLNSSFEESLLEGKKLLKDYMAGNNFKVDKILTRGPYFQVQKADSWEIGVILPSELSVSSIPKPINRAIRLESFLPLKVGALKFKGDPSTEKFLRRGEELKRWLKFKGITPHGPLRVSRPDQVNPFSIFRYNEVQIDVQ